ncbi:Cyclic nucleotide-gated ion channel 4 [Zea mays]|uniref:Cyclic nucleotide-gated ion channel 4 n=3 Tax=Zea mays TaxID=4577 RepID=A0AAQ5KSI2_MAIZE|nr:cyclic nucleotide-gated ion channel 2 isoform 1 [Zea mays]XP_035817388.1 cyclic nucleotide-gated ion channel 2 isoform X2 [Zea mays]AQK99954.1 Cyclic nucleotide-gated ion channel 4 [Zea mays]PWZ04003.1 Cyclic nucleotide-gated ion channel 4 [Zea mays]PWZ12278.1 Cyclic nucleotide-gated ion channel 4 [Zea mays]|eukprot:XP_008655080.3 cyclic nucleotide-gated ion channel 2 isoform X2 [Zea mays]
MPVPAELSPPSPHGAPRTRAGEQDDSTLPPTAAATATATRGGTGRKRRRGARDPRASWAWETEWDRAYLLACAAGLLVDPLFLYAVAVSAPLMCVFLDAWFAAAVTALRCAVDAMHASNLLLRLRGACSPRREDTDEEEAQPGRDGGVPGRGTRSKEGVFLDVLVILPVMQVVVWVATPAMIRAGSTTDVMIVLLTAFLLEYLPKIYHAVRVLRRMQGVSGYLFGTIWWGIALNLMAYFVAAHAVGACWYLLGAQRATKCLREQCAQAGSGCAPWALACAEPLYYGATASSVGAARLAWAGNATARGTCLDSADNYQYGAYQWTVMLVANPSRVERVLLPIFWGLMTLSTFGNLESTTEWLEIVFNIVTITGGLILVTMLIGNIKVFLNATTSKKQAMHTRLRSVELWMKRKDLPRSYRHRVRQYERQRWAATRGVDECRIVRDLPEGLRRDIKYHLCLGLVRQVPLFQHMDDLVLENICDRVKSLIFPKGEVIVREGDPVKRMLFIVRGHLQSSQVLRNGAESCCMLGPGNFSGDELLSWCLRRPFLERLPGSSSTLATLESTEAFGLDAADVKYVTQHFRYTFTNDKVRRSARYYSPGWRTWAAVAVQLAWRRYKHRKTLASLSFIRPRRPLSRCSSLGEEKLRLYTALLTSPKPNQDDLL